MPRPSRADEAGSIYHALNRGNARQTIFHKPEDYEAFLRVLDEGLERYPVRTPIGFRRALLFTAQGLGQASIGSGLG